MQGSESVMVPELYRRKVIDIAPGGSVTFTLYRYLSPGDAPESLLVLFSDLLALRGSQEYSDAQKLIEAHVKVHSSLYEHDLEHVLAEWIPAQNTLVGRDYTRRELTLLMGDLFVSRLGETIPESENCSKLFYVPFNVESN